MNRPFCGAFVNAPYKFIEGTGIPYAPHSSTICKFQRRECIYEFRYGKTERMYLFPTTPHPSAYSDACFTAGWSRLGLDHSQDCHSLSRRRFATLEGKLS